MHKVRFTSYVTVFVTISYYKFGLFNAFGYI